MANCNSVHHFVWRLAAIIALGQLLTQVPQCDAHGRLIEPPSRASAWRYGFKTPRNYNDNGTFCGGLTRQKANGGKCGECGDPWNLPTPRPNEFGGKWGLGVVVRNYNPGAEIRLRIDLTTSHKGYFEFRVCPELAAQQSCLDKHLLELLGGTPSVVHSDDLSTRFYPRNGSRIYEIMGKLPNDLECANCVLQWRYIGGYNWGICPNGTGATGCGPQDEFRACADISIYQYTPPLLGPLIAFIALLAVLCVLVAIYLCYYHGQHIKHMLMWSNDHKASKQTAHADATHITISATTTTLPPAPAPLRHPFRRHESKD